MVSGPVFATSAPLLVSNQLLVCHKLSEMKPGGAVALEALP
jgi:hypothetical protein